MRVFWNSARKFAALTFLVGSICASPSYAAQSSCNISGITSATMTVAATNVNLSSGAVAIPVTVTVKFSTGSNQTTTPSNCILSFGTKTGVLTNSAGASVPYEISTSTGTSGSISFIKNHAKGLGVAVADSPTTQVLHLYMIVSNGNYAAGAYSDKTASIEIDNVGNNGANVPQLAIAVNFVYNADYCTIGGLFDGGTQTLTFSSANSTIDTGQQTATFGSVTCNAATHIDITSSKNGAYNGSATTAAVSGGYANFFNYTAVATFDTATTSLTTKSGSGGSSSSVTAPVGTQSSGAASGSMTVVVTPAANSKVSAGTYSDTLTVTLTAK
jgi:hypothetical protein